MTLWTGGASDSRFLRQEAPSSVPSWNLHSATLLWARLALCSTTLRACRREHPSLRSAPSRCHSGLCRARKRRACHFVASVVLLCVRGAGSLHLPFLLSSSLNLWTRKCRGGGGQEPFLKVGGSRQEGEKAKIRRWSRSRDVVPSFGQWSLGPFGSFPIISAGPILELGPSVPFWERAASGMASGGACFGTGSHRKAFQGPPSFSSALKKWGV